MRTYCLLFFLPVLVTATLAQDLKNYPWELSGTFSYDYSNTISPYGPVATWYDKSDRLEFSPELGYYLNDYVQPIAGIEYSWAVHRHNSFESGPPDSPPPGEIHARTDLHRVGAYGGAAIHIPLSETVRLFVGGRIGASASWYFLKAEGTVTYNRQPTVYKEAYRRPLGKAELTAPSLFFWREVWSCFGLVAQRQGAVF